MQLTFKWRKTLRTSSKSPNSLCNASPEDDSGTPRSLIPAVSVVCEATVDVGIAATWAKVFFKSFTQLVRPVNSSCLPPLSVVAFSATFSTDSLISWIAFFKSAYSLLRSSEAVSFTIELRTSSFLLVATHWLQNSNRFAPISFIAAIAVLDKPAHFSLRWTVLLQDTQWNTCSSAAIPFWQELHLLDSEKDIPASLPNLASVIIKPHRQG